MLLLLNVMAPAPEFSSVPPAIVNLPVPMAVPTVRFKAPLLSVVPPL